VNVNGTKKFDASREVVWSVIDDPGQMAGLMPGVEAIEIKDERHWQPRSRFRSGLAASR